ncbi:hypothetical protein AVEN_170597-1 [Araneus ventricosus]|uniref:Mutator-like transposase domain-containing protein n=1 Tax=Araneus ventricosus TaxID=182803 RepID=A0A4Y2BKF1_ARAVE|nr:hypothetical protein AVEN_61690-1 [Araneus ventricosus]GBL92249.1 hypothetical protein AVEN_170597-1 [Araneus ventricosus]
MESDAIVEGLLYLESTHGIPCTRMGGDGDSNTIIKCKERVSNGGRILKVECANHAVRRTERPLQKFQLSAARFKGVEGIRGSKIFKQRMMRLIKGARNVIEVNSIKNHDEPQEKQF